MTPAERTAIVGDTIARDLWRKYKGQGSVCYLACLADLAVKAAGQPDLTHSVFRETVKALEELRRASEKPQLKLMQ